MYRGISDNLFKQVGHRTEGKKNFFPMWDAYGQLIGTMINNECGTIKHDHIIHKEFKGVSYLYGEWLLPKLFYGKPVVVVEGVYDCLSLLQEKIPCIAVTTNELNKGKIKKIRRYTNKIVFWFDSDSHGERGIEETLKRMKEFPDLQYRIFTCNLAKDPNDLHVNQPTGFQTYIQELKKMMEEMR